MILNITKDIKAALAALGKADMPVYSSTLPREVGNIEEYIIFILQNTRPHLFADGKILIEKTEIDIHFFCNEKSGGLVFLQLFLQQLQKNKKYLQKSGGIEVANALFEKKQHYVASVYTFLPPQTQTEIPQTEMPQRNIELTKEA